MALQANQLVDRLVVFGVPRSSAVPIVRTIAKWVRSSGKEWTVDHLKLIKQTIISIQAGYEPGVSPFVKVKDGHLVGQFRVLQDLVFKTQKAAYSALFAYTSFVAGSVTKKQKQKFLDAVLRPSPSKANPKTYWDDIDFKVKIPLKLKHPGRIEDRSGSPSKFMPTNDKGSLPESDNLLEQMDFWYKNCSIWDYCNPYKHSSPLSTYLMSLSRYSVVPSFNMKEETPNHVGFVSVIQEPGYKARFIANPSRFWQQALEPLGDVLFDSLRSLPWDCTYDQNKGITKIQKHLFDGKPAFSVDLSNATDQFPLDIQVSLIKRLTVQSVMATEPRGRFNHLTEPDTPMLLGLFEALSRAPMWMPSEGISVSWKKGQPLGLYPSFAMFALTHGMMIYQLCLRLGIYRFYDDPPFYVLGDDVVILSEPLYHAYMAELDLLGVQTSKPKSLTSHSYVEFAGRLVSSDNVLSSFKWRSISPDNWFDYLHNLGPKALDLLPRNIREVASKVVSLPEPLGFGWNPDGLSLEERLGDLIDIYLFSLEPIPAVGVEGASLYEDIRFRTRNRVILNDLRVNTKIHVPQVDQTRGEIAYETIRNLFLTGLMTPDSLVKTINYLILRRGLLRKNEGQVIFDQIKSTYPEHLTLVPKVRDKTLLDRWRTKLLSR